MAGIGDYGKMTMRRAIELVEEAGFPPGVINLVNGGPDTVNAILDHPAIRAISFVGSTPMARHIYARAAVSAYRHRAVLKIRWLFCLMLM